MADDKIDIKQLVEDEQNGKIGKDALKEKIQAIISAGTFDYDLSQLAGLKGLAGKLEDNDELKAALLKKIDERFAQLEQSENMPSPENQPKNPSDKPEEHSNEPKESSYDELPSFDLRKKFEKAVEDENKDDVQGILQYVTEQWKNQKLTIDNAPLISDYAQILQKGGYNIESSDLKNIEEALIEYDKKHELDNLNITAEQHAKNTEAWDKFMSEHDILAEQLPNFVASGLDEQAKKEAYELLKSMTINQLALEEPSEDEKENEVRLIKKLKDALTVYRTTFEATLTDQDKNDEMLDEFLRRKNLSRETYLQSYDKADEETKKLMKGEFLKFKVGLVAESVHADFHNRNAIFASRVAQKTNAEATPEHVRESLGNFVKAHPKAFAIAKNVLVSAGASFVFGPVGMAAVSAYKFGSAVFDSYKRFKKNQEQTGETKGFLGNFTAYIGYLRKNPDEALALGKAFAGAAIAGAFAGYGIAQGVQSFGMAGNLMGSAADTAKQAALAGIRRITSLGTTSAFAGITTVLKNRQIRPKKAEMMEILSKYIDTNKPKGKGLFGKLFSKNSEAEKAYNDLTGILQKGKDDKLQAKIEAMIPDMKAEDKERLVALAKEIITLKQTKAAAIGGAVFGAAAYEVNETLQEHNILGNTGSESSYNPGSEDKGYDFNKPLYEQGDKLPLQGMPEHEEPSQIPLRPGEHLEEPSVEDVVTVHPFEATDSKNYDFAINATPTPTYEKLMEMGVLSKEQAHELMGGRSYIPSRVLKDFIENKAQFTDEQAKEFNEFVNDHQARLKEFMDYKESHSSSGAGLGGSAGEIGNGQNLENGNDEPNFNISVQNGEPQQPEAEYIHSFTGRAHSKLVGYQKEETNVDVIDNNSKTTQASFAEAGKQLHEQNPDKSRFKIEDSEGNSAKVHIGKDHTTVKTHYTDENGNEYIKKTKIDNETGTEVSKFKGEGRAVPSNQVGNPDGENDRVMKQLEHTKGRMAVVRDGKSKDYYVVERDTEGKTTYSEAMSKREAYKEFKTAVKEAKNFER